jgi:hypothetical protein
MLEKKQNVIFLDGYVYSKAKKAKAKGWIRGFVCGLLIGLAFVVYQEYQPPKVIYETIERCTQAQISQAVEDRLQVIIDG